MMSSSSSSSEETDIVSSSSRQVPADMNFYEWIASITIPLKEIASATNNFADENLIAKGSYANVYKGKLLQSGELINIVVRKVHQAIGYIIVNELNMYQNLKHRNIVSLFRVDDTDDHAFMIYKYETNKSLDKYLSDSTLTWRQRLKICVGTARALRYLHLELNDDYSVVHGNVKSSNILLDHNWEAKLHDFRCAIKVKRHGLYLTNKYNGTLQYMDPAYENTGGLTHKSDVFSFGVVLFEVLFGRTASNEIPNEQDNWYFARLARSHYEEGTLDDMIDPDLRKQMDLQSFKIFSETAYFCLKEQRAQRPDIDQIVRRLVKALDFQYKHEPAEHSIVATSQHQKTTLKVADYLLLSRHPLNEGLPFLSSNPPMNQVNGTIISFSPQEFGKLQIPLEDVSSATSNFAEENMFAQGGFGKLYKGRLRWADDMIDIVARRLDSMHGQGEIELWMEISMLSSLKHNNLASIVGFCDENGEKIIIYEHACHKSLDQHLTDETLTWSQRLQICLGVAQALNYIHYDKDVIHCDISSSKILIDRNWEAKVFGFGLSTKYPGNWGHQLLFSHYYETSASRDQVYVKTSSVTPKYDVYSFGILLYEVLCGRKPMIRHNSAMEKLDEMIDPHLREQMDSNLLNIYTKTAYSCLNQQHVYRPTMHHIVKELEGALDPQGEAEELEPSIFVDEAASSNSLTEEDMERLVIDLSHIKEATNNFSKDYRIGEGGFAEVYKANLEHLGIQSRLSEEEIQKGELPKRHSTVAIKRIVGKQSKQDFFAEVAMLNSCKHQNIISLLGISNEYPEMILVCEFASNGSLADCLEKNKMINVTWAQRLQICLDIAHGLNYLHSDKVGKRRIIHRDVKSANVLLDEKWNAKVSDFGLSKFHPKNQLTSSIHTLRVAGTERYVDPEYNTKGIYRKASDIYSFGVVLFEIFSGKLAHHHFYFAGNDKGLASVARRCFKEKTLKELIDPKMLEDADEHIFTVNKGPNQKSLDTFLNIAHSCLAEIQKERPQMQVIIQELQNAINFQGKTLVLLKFRLSDIKLGTKSFADINFIGVGAYGMMYNADLSHFDNKRLSERKGKNVAVKRIFNREDQHGKQGFFEEIEMLDSCKHPNIVGLLGISSEDREMVLVYKDAFQGSLHDCFGNTEKMANLTWVRRIQISLDIAQGLNYLLTSVKDKQKIMQFGMNCANILLDDDWRAKIACFWLSTLPAIQEADTSNVVERKEKLDPEYMKTDKLKKESSIYSFGVILFEILCGRLEYDEFYNVENEKGLPTIVRGHFDAGTLIEIIDPRLQQTDKKKPQLKKPRLHEDVTQDSFNAYSEIAYQCLAETQADRPSMEVILKALQTALSIQEEYLKLLKIHVIQKVEDLEHLKIPLSDIVLATENFAKKYLIGAGGSGLVYRAELYHFDGVNSSAIEGKNEGEFLKRRSTVAIKRIFNKGQGELGFFREIETLINLKHPNIVSILGFCKEGIEMILVYEYAFNGSLDAYMRNADNVTNFTWAQRIQISLDIAYGLNYLHTSTADKQCIIHRDIKSDNILLDGNWVAKIADVGLLYLHHANKHGSTVVTKYIAGTEMYLDPEYAKTGKLKTKSDIYSFGVVLFELMCGRMAYDSIYGENGLPSIARRCFRDGTLNEMIDLKIMEGAENFFMLNGGLSPDSLDTFSKIAYHCLAELQNERPTMEVVIKELEKARDYQKNIKDYLHIPLEDLKLVTENFSDSKCIREGRYWKQYEGEIQEANGCTVIIVKRWDSKSDQGTHQFRAELKALFEHKHENIIGFVGYCNDMDENIIVYEHAANGSLDKYVKDASLKWMKRLKICIDVASGLEFLHTEGRTQKIPLIHRDLKSSSILLNDDWRAKISNLELSAQASEVKEIEHVTDDNAYGSLAYVCPESKKLGYLTTESDIYSLGVVLKEILRGGLARAAEREDLKSDFVTRNGPEILDGLVFVDIEDDIDPKSLAAFKSIAGLCLAYKKLDRPKAREVVTKLKKAYEFQEDYEIWEPKLPSDYKEIIRTSSNPEIYDSTELKKDLYHMLSRGILMKDGKVWFSLGSNGERNEMISAKRFSYKNHLLCEWRYIPESRFPKVAEILNISNLKIQIKIRTQFLSPGFNYKVHLVFKFCGPIKSLAKRMYVNLKYKRGNESLHAYFAKWREDGWMMIELFQFLNQKIDTDFEVLLESFSRCYCGSQAIYIEGIEFHAFDNVILDENTKIPDVNKKTEEHQQVLRSNSNKDEVPSGSQKMLKITENDGETDYKVLLNEVNGKKHLMLSAKEVVYDSSNVKLFSLKPSAESRFQEVIEVLPHQVLRINCKIASQMLSQDTEYVCYLVFKLEEKCRGLHCPVKVQNLLHRKNKEAEFLYFRSPSPWNLQDINYVPKQREDGWMEVKVWKFNSNRELKNDFIRVNLKLISYEGTMSGLVVCGLELRPL